MISYWEQQSFTSYDLVIIGAGITGLSAALELRKLHQEKRILILERGLFPSGASTRNAGFACMGSLTELLNDLESMPAKVVADLFARRKAGLELLRERLGDAAIGYESNGSYELITHKELPALEKIVMVNKLLEPVTGKPAFRLAPEKTAAFGFDRGTVLSIVENTCEGELNTGMMMRALTDLAIGNGIEIKTGIAVTGWEEKKGRVAVMVKDPVFNTRVALQCSQLFICTNAFTKTLLPGAPLVPGRGQVLVTEPLSDIPFRGIFHFDQGYYYFRVIDDRILIGGGRNLDFKKEATTAMELNDRIQQDLEDKLNRVILPGRVTKVAFRWSGIMAFGDSKQPVIGKFGNNVFGAFRLGGMGVALGSQVARDLALLSVQ